MSTLFFCLIVGFANSLDKMKEASMPNYLIVCVCALPIANQIH